MNKEEIRKMTKEELYKLSQQEKREPFIMTVKADNNPEKLD